MKAVNANPAPTPAPKAEAAKAQNTAAAGNNDAGTDFLALFTQAMSGAPAAETPSELQNAGLNLTSQQEEGTGDSDEAELAALMAALASANAIPVQSVATKSELSGDAVGAKALQGTDLASAVMNALTDQAATDAVKNGDSKFDATLKAADADATTVDPRLGQTGLDAVREARTQQTDAPMQRLHSPVGTRAWADELGHQITWMTDKGHQTASLRLSPEHLGPLEIQISIQDDKASVWFGAAHADTRAAIENALPRLRDMLATQGLALNDAGVFKEPPRQQAQYKVERHASGGDAGPAPLEEVRSVRMSILGLVDAYA